MVSVVFMVLPGGFFGICFLYCIRTNTVVSKLYSLNLNGFSLKNSMCFDVR